MPLTLTPAQIAASIEATGIGFMFAPNHHPAMKNVGPVRKELGIRTIFNILGPLTNPGRRAEHPDGRVPSRPGRHPGARAAAARRRACRRRLRQGRDGRGLARRGDDGRRAEGRRGQRVRDPSRGLRPDDGEQPGAAGRDAGAVEGDARGGARRRARARRATSSRSTPAPRSMPPMSRRRSPPASTWRRTAIGNGSARAKLDEFVAFARRQGEVAAR